MPLVAHWPLHEGIGDANDIENSYNGTVGSGVTQGAEGLLGSTGYDFEGTSDKVVTGNISEYQGASELSYAVWVNLTQTEWQDSTNYVFTAHNNDATDQIVLQKGGSSDEAYFNVESGGTRTNTSATVSPDYGDYNLAVGAFSAPDGYLYFNGEQVATSSGPSQVPNLSADFTIGDWSPTSGFTGSSLPGSVAEVRVYDHALTAGEVQYLYDATKEPSKAVTQEKTL